MGAFDELKMSGGEIKLRANSPRTIEACARQGILFEELQHKSMDAFREPGLQSFALQMRYDHHEHKRQEKPKLVQREWKRVDREFAGLDPSMSKGSADMSFLGGDDANQATIRREQMQMEKLQRRQQQEIEQMLAHEIKMSEIQQQMEEKERQEAERHEAHLADVARRKKEFEKLAKERKEQEKAAAERKEKIAKKKKALQEKKDKEAK